MKRLAACLFTAIVWATGAVAHADSLFEKYFANADGGTPCYTRVYDAQHLRRNPHQKVRQITLAFDHAKVPWCQHLHRPKVDICGSVHQ